MRIVIEVKRDEEPEIILNKLFKMTQMQESFGMILLAIVGGQPRELGLFSCCNFSSSTALTLSAAARSTTCARPASASTSCSATASRSTISTM